MNPPTPARRATSHYDAVQQAARTIQRELEVFSDDSDIDDNPKELEREVWLLRSTLEFYLSNGVYPFATSESRKQFCEKWVKMKEEDYFEENEKLRKKYKKRVIKICKKFQQLVPREQHAFDVGSVIWGSRIRSIADVEQVQEDAMALEEDHSTTPKEEEEEDPLTRFKFLKKTFDISKALMIPVVSKDVVKEGLESLGDTKMKEWNGNWKKMQIQEINNFLERVSLIKEQTMLLLKAIENE